MDTMDATATSNNAVQPGQAMESTTMPMHTQPMTQPQQQQTFPTPPVASASGSGQPPQLSDAPQPTAAFPSNTPPTPTLSLPTPFHRTLYNMIVSQLADDGLTTIAASLAQAAGFIPPMQTHAHTQTPEHNQASPTLPRLDKDLLAKVVAAGLEKAANKQAEERRTWKLAAKETVAAAQEEQEATEERKEGVTDEEKVTSDHSISDTVASSPFSNLNSPLFDLSSPFYSNGMHRLVSERSAPFPTDYTLRFVTSHKDAVLAAAYSKDGSIVATGSRDASIKILDVTRMRTHTLAQSQREMLSEAERVSGSVPSLTRRGENVPAARPLLHTFVDHTLSIADLEFHPFEPMVLSASRDGTARFFDCTPVLMQLGSGTDGEVGASESGKKQLSRRSHKILNSDDHGAAPLTALSFHPSGDYVVVSSENPIIRLFDVRTFAAFVSADFGKFHRAPVTDVMFQPGSVGGVYASTSMDGSIKVWDTRTQYVVHSIEQAHGGTGVVSAQFSPSGQFLLTNGLDSVARLRDVRMMGQRDQTGDNDSNSSGTSRVPCVQTYIGANHPWPQHNPVGLPAPPLGSAGPVHDRVAFEHSGEWIFAADDSNSPGGVAVWDTRTGEMVRRLDGHSKSVRCIVASPTEAAFVTCSDDNRARFWST